eukprot:12920066-Prorocentrum_lima.AAC.1
MERLEIVGTLYISGGPAVRGGRAFTISGLQHVIVGLGHHFRELDQDEIVRGFRSIEEALARFELVQAVATTMN